MLKVCLTALYCFVAICCLVRVSGTEFSLGIRDSIMIAHSFKGEEFGPAQNLHGATYTVDAEIMADRLVDGVNWVIDIGLFSDMLSEILKKYNFQHLNDIFPNENTTTEFMCRVIHNDLKSKLEGKCRGKMTIKLFESHKAWATFSGEL